VKEGVFDGSTGANDGKQSSGVWVDQTGDVSDCLVGVLPGFFVDAGSAHDSDGPSTWEAELPRC
jgi:hypothetical protein